LGTMRRGVRWKGEGEEWTTLGRPDASVGQADFIAEEPSTGEKKKVGQV